MTDPLILTAPQILRLALFILASIMAAYGAHDRRPALSIYWAGVAVYWLVNFVVS